MKPSRITVGDGFRFAFGVFLCSAFFALLGFAVGLLGMAGAISELGTIGGPR